MNDFRDGDVIECINNKNASTLKVGEKYTVLWTRRFPDSVILKEIEGEWFLNRFKKVN